MKFYLKQAFLILLIGGVIGYGVYELVLYPEYFTNRVGKLLVDRPQGAWFDERKPNPKLPTVYIRWEVWCPPCLKSVSHNNILFRKYSKSFNFVGITSQDNDGVREYAKTRIEYPVLYSKEKSFDRFFELGGLPFVAIVGAGGEVLNNDVKLNTEALDQILKEIKRKNS